VGRLRLCLLILPALLVVPPTESASPDPFPPPPVTQPEAKFLSVSSDHPFTRDRPLLATVSPNGDGYRDFVTIRFFLTGTALVTVKAQTAQRTFQRVAQPKWSVNRRMDRGWQTVVWRPSPGLEPTTYVILVTVASGRRSLRYGRLTHNSDSFPGPIVRVLGVDASFDRSSYAPGDTAQLTIASDSIGLTLRIADVAASETQPTVNSLDGPDLIEPQHYPWDANRDNAVRLPVPIGEWKPGVYFAVIRTDAGTVGYAPLIVKAPQPMNRVAVIVPDQTWYAYDFYDGDHDGFPDSWYYAGGPDVVQLARPFDHSGVPWLFGSQAWPFLRWLRLHNVQVDFLAEADAQALGAALADDYDLIVVPTHLEYVTEAEYDALAHYRDAGGDLIFLASNDLYWKVDVGGSAMHRNARWRELGRPEAALVGAQYAGSKTGDAAPYIVGDSAAAWAFDGTGLATSDLFSYAGAEFDVRTAASPPDTQVLATVRTPTHRGEMTYYELGNAKVFAPGTFFSGRLLRPEESRLLENVWNRSDALDLPTVPSASR
jgi:hypothetical protein